MSVDQGAEGQAVLPALAGTKNNRSVAATQPGRAAEAQSSFSDVLQTSLLLQKASGL